MMNAREVSPFTPIQWQELEHQALIFKYMASGVPIPSVLLYTFRRSLEPMSWRFFSPKTKQWGCFQMGLGNNADPEPGRCRRTDGKKWRCTKDAFQDSKYCEKHMHRGKNRSRKPVEAATSSTNPTTNPSVTRSANAPSITSTQNNQIYSNNLLQHTFINHLSSPSCSLNKTSDFDLMSRSLHGFKDDIGGHSFFSGGSATTRNVHDSIPLNDLSPPYPSLIVGTHSQSLRNSYTQSQIQKEQSCFVMGTDFKSERTANVGREEKAQQPIRHFFHEWPPPKNRDSCIDLEEDRVNGSSFSTTQLSISFPMASPEFSVADAQSHDGDR